MPAVLFPDAIAPIYKIYPMFPSTGNADASYEESLFQLMTVQTALITLCKNNGIDLVKNLVMYGRFVIDTSNPHKSSAFRNTSLMSELIVIDLANKKINVGMLADSLALVV